MSSKTLTERLGETLTGCHGETLTGWREGVCQAGRDKMILTLVPSEDIDSLVTRIGVRQPAMKLSVSVMVKL